MGQEAEQQEREKAFAGYCLDEALVGLAKPDCLVLHCLPAHRGEEISDAVIEGKNSVVWDEAENRLHVQKAIMATLDQVGDAPVESRNIQGNFTRIKSDRCG